MHHQDGDRPSLLSQEDIATLERMLGRPARAAIEIVKRCPAGNPMVVLSNPFLPDGSPFPTTFWLTCPSLVKSVSRLEGEGLIDELEKEMETNEQLKREFAQAQRDYQRARGNLSQAEHASMATGIGGVRDLGRIKCLHAHVAHFLVGGMNPIGKRITETVGIPECRERCA